MMGDKYLYEIIFLTSVFISSVSQVILKKSTSGKYGRKVWEYLNPYVLSAYGLFMLSSVMTTLAYKYVPLSRGQMLEASGYIHVAVLSTIFLKEHLNKGQVLGMICIIVGIGIYTA